MDGNEHETIARSNNCAGFACSRVFPVVAETVVGMPLDNLISIGGASGGGGSKRGTSNDLTSGLISISGARDNVDIDMDDFDVGDLLGDDSGKCKSKSKDKSDDKKKHKSKDKEKSKSSKKKSKSKSKKSVFDDFDNDDRDDWKPSTKNWDSTAELEMAAAAAARRKAGSSKLGGGLGDEFAKTLGGDIASGTDVESTEYSPDPVVSMNRDDDKKFDTDDTFEISGYTPTVRGSKKLDRKDAIISFGVDESGKGGNEGVSASFFQDDDKSIMNSTSLSSLLGPTSERRGGARGGRRQTGAPVEFDSTLDSATPAQDIPAKRDLFADLFPTEPRRGDRHQQSSFSKSEDVVAADNEIKGNTGVLPEPKPVVLPVAVDPAKQQDDLLAELFATPSTSKRVTHGSSREADEQPITKSATVEVRSSTPPKEKTPPPPKRADLPKDSAQPSASSNVDFTSAKDSLLMDLLGDLSPPKPKEPLQSRRRGRNSNNTSPEKESTAAEDPFTSSLPSSPVQLKPLTIVQEVPTATQAVLFDVNTKPVPPPSPGRIRSLTVDKVALAIRESEFEQSKDSLLEELLPSSPVSISARSSPHRRKSYSQSFEAENSIAFEVVQEQRVIEEKELQIPDSPAPVAPVLMSSPPPQTDPVPIDEPSKMDPPQTHVSKKSKEKHLEQVVLVPACNCVERQTELTAVFDLERTTLNQQLGELTQQLEAQTASSTQLTQQLEAQTASTLQLTQQLEALEASSSQLMQQLSKQLEEKDIYANQVSQQLEARAAANEQLVRQLATAESEKLQADQLAATSKNDAAAYQHRVELLEADLRALREELSRSKRAVQDAELALARKLAEQDEVDQLERHREKRALEALSAQMQRALARLTVSHQVQEEGAGYDNSAARVAAEDEARLRVIASLEGSSKRAAHYAEQERGKLAELLRELEAGARNARQGALEDKERLRQEQQRLDALSAHLQAQTAALRDQETAHSSYMGQQLAEAREDARVYEARLATRRTQLERDERALYEARADFAAFREQTALEIGREHEELRASRLALEDAWRELRADREDLDAELAGHENEFQDLENLREEVHGAEARLAKRTQEVVALAENLDAGTRDLLAREQLVAEQAAIVQDTDSSMVNRERALERVKSELEAREQRLHVQIRQLDGARGRLTQQRREQQQLISATRRHYSTADNSNIVAVDNNKPWRRSEFTSVNHGSSNNNSRHSAPVVDKLKSQPWETHFHVEEDPSGLSPALRKQVEANWSRNQHIGQRRQGSGLTFDIRDFDSTMAAASKWSSKTYDHETPCCRYTRKKNNVNTLKVSNISAQQNPHPRQSPQQSKPPQQQVKPIPSTVSRAPSLAGPQLPLPPSRPGTFQPTLLVNL